MIIIVCRGTEAFDQYPCWFCFHFAMFKTVDYWYLEIVGIVTLCQVIYTKGMITLVKPSHVLHMFDSLKKYGFLETGDGETATTSLFYLLVVCKT
jgi:hypothetical protein